jgi:hypothetical protein
MLRSLMLGAVASFSLPPLFLLHGGNTFFEVVSFQTTATRATSNIEDGAEEKGDASVPSGNMTIILKLDDIFKNIVK